MMESSLIVPPGFRFHPTEEELVGYYLNRKVNDLNIDLDVITDIDLYRIEPWDIQDRCKLGYEEQSEWYFFSHKDRKYPTGTRTNRATAAGFWKATGRDKAVLSKEKLIGMRKTLVFYKGRAPNGTKTDWIMHEYRLQPPSHHPTPPPSQEEGWVVCRAFKKPSPSHHQKQFFESWTTSSSSSSSSSHPYTYMRLENANFRPPPPPPIYNRQTTINNIENTNFLQNPYPSSHQHHEDLMIMTAISNNNQQLLQIHLPQLDDDSNIPAPAVGSSCFEQQNSTSICSSSDQEDKKTTSTNNNNNNQLLFNYNEEEEEWKKLLVSQVHDHHNLTEAATAAAPISNIFASEINQPLLLPEAPRDHDELLLGCFTPTTEL